MNVDNFEIVLDRPSKEYFPGERITGHIVIQVDKQGNIEALGLRLWGKASVSWENGGSKSGKKRKESQQVAKSVGEQDNMIVAEETYFDRRVPVLEKTGPEVITIPSGQSRYPFEIPLPSGIPSSFQGEHGQINYYLEATMKRVGSQDSETNCHLLVKGILDLNNNHEAQVDRPEVATEKHLCCLCCKSGPIGFHFRILGKSGWVSDDTIPFSAEGYNMSNAGAVSLALRFVQTITYSAKEKSKVVSKELFKMEGPCISRGGTGLWNSENIQLPSDLPPTKLAGRCQIINVEYKFDVVLEMSRGSSLSAEIPIIIGTIPLGSSIDDILRHEA